MRSCMVDFLTQNVKIFDKVSLQLTGNLFFFRNCNTAIKVSFSFFEGFDLEAAVVVVLELAAMLKLAARDWDDTKH